jgi:signal transduction histidine kinase
VIGTGLVTLAEMLGWIPVHLIWFHGRTVTLWERPGHVGANLAFFTASILVTAVLSNLIMKRLRERVVRLAEATDQVSLLNDELNALMEDRTRFMLQVAHNLRAPLSAAVALLETVSGAYLGPVSPEQSATLGRIERRLRSMTQTIGELLTLARTRDAGPELIRGPLDLGALLEQVDGNFREEALRRGLALTVTCVPDPPRIAGDPNLMQQLLENLISNALKYTPRGGCVDVGLTSEAGRVRLEVRDTGIGISPEDQAHLFTEFFRAANARRLEEEGTGLGLPIVKQIAELHGGDVQVESELGKGTRMVVRLPVS